MEAVQKLKANLKLENKPCGWCNQGLRVGDDAAVCTTCLKEHHDRCWEGKGGCSSPGCVNAPLKRLDAPAPGYAGAPMGAPPMAAALPPGLMRCPRCGNAIAMGSDICPMCRAITSPDGLYHGPKITAPGATAALVCGIIGLFFCGVILGIVAIVKGNEAKRSIASDPTYGGGGMATAGIVLGILDLIGWAIFLLVRLSAT
jgi:hypothetical protein